MAQAEKLITSGVPATGRRGGQLTILWGEQPAAAPTGSPVAYLSDLSRIHPDIHAELLRAHVAGDEPNLTSAQKLDVLRYAVSSANPRPTPQKIAESIIQIYLPDDQGTTPDATVLETLHADLGKILDVSSKEADHEIARDVLRKSPIAWALLNQERIAIRNVLSVADPARPTKALNSLYANSSLAFVHDAPTAAPAPTGND